MSAQDIFGTVTSTENAREYYEETYIKGLGMDEAVLEEGTSGIPLTGKMNKGLEVGPESVDREKGYTDEYVDTLEKRFGTKSPFLALMTGGKDYEVGQSKVVDKTLANMQGVDYKDHDDLQTKAGTIDAGVAQASVPIAVDPRVVDIQRSKAAVVTRVPQEVQAGYKAAYNVISGRDIGGSMLSESEANDLSNHDDGDFDMPRDEKEMKIYVSTAKVSDFSQRAAAGTLDYIDLAATTAGQHMIGHALFKAQQMLYGDPGIGSGAEDIQDDDAYEGFAKIFDDAGQSVDETGTSISSFLEDVKSKMTNLVATSGATYDNLEVWVSPDMFDEMENEANPNVRLDSFDQDVNYGARSIQIKGVEVVECPNIGRVDVGAPGGYDETTFSPDNGDVFIVDTSAARFRALAPLSTMPLARNGLADRTAFFEYGTLIDKSQGNHGLFIEYGELGA
jgi:hypothetical protein